MNVHEWLKLDLRERQEAFNAMPPEEQAFIREQAVEINTRREAIMAKPLVPEKDHWEDTIKPLAMLVLPLAVIVLGCFMLYRCEVARDEVDFAPKPSIQQRMGPSASSSPAYGQGYDLGHQMGLSGAGSPTDDALRSMSATQAPDDQLQFRAGYRNGLLAGQQERAKK